MSPACFNLLRIVARRAQSPEKTTAISYFLQDAGPCRLSNADYLKIVAMIVSKAEGPSLDSEMRDAAVEQFIEERRQKALVMIAKMRGEPSPSDAAGKPWEGSGTA
jgi:hypothetical protein